MVDLSALSDGESGADKNKNSKEERPWNNNYLSETGFLTAFPNIGHTYNLIPAVIHSE